VSGRTAIADSTNSSERRANSGDCLDSYEKLMIHDVDLINVERRHETKKERGEKTSKTSWTLLIETRCAPHLALTVLKALPAVGNSAMMLQAFAFVTRVIVPVRRQKCSTRCFQVLMIF
jgi:hypothetical protein